MNEFEDSFVHYLDEWSTETNPDVIVFYNFLDGEKSVGEADRYEIAVIRGRKDIWDLLTHEEQSEVEEYCEQHRKISIENWSKP
jgi:hypothetical protein